MTSRALINQESFMKKILVAFMTACVVFLAGCSKIEVKNEKGWWTDYDECLKAASESGKKIMMVISADEVEKSGETLKQELFYTEVFMQKYQDEYEFCEIDVSPSLIVNAFPKNNIPEAIRNDKAKTRKFLNEHKKGQRDAAKILEKRMKIMATFDVTHRPMMVFITKEGYPIADVQYFPSAQIETFDEIIEYYSPRITEYLTLVETAHNSTGLDRVKAIDDLYNRTSNSYRYHLTELMREIPKLDKENKSQLVGKYLLALATSDTIDATIARKPHKIAQIYEKVAKNKFLSKQEQQQAYFAELYIIGKNSPTDKELKQMKVLLDKIILLDPSSPIGMQAASKLEQLNEFIKRREEYEKKIKEESEGSDN